MSYSTDDTSSIVRDILSDIERDKYSGEYVRQYVSKDDRYTFYTLYQQEALAIESTDTSHTYLSDLNTWFRITSKCEVPMITMHCISGTVMNEFYHLTNINRYPDNNYIIAINWRYLNVTEPFKGRYRWFTDIIDKNARYEISILNPMYKHFTTLYHDDIGWDN